MEVGSGLVSESLRQRVEQLTAERDSVLQEHRERTEVLLEPQVGRLTELQTEVAVVEAEVQALEGKVRDTRQLANAVPTSDNFRALMLLAWPAFLGTTALVASVWLCGIATHVLHTVVGAIGLFVGLTLLARRKR